MTTNQPRFYPLNRHIKALPTVYALYALQHDPTGKRFYASTDNLRKRLEHWHYMIERKKLDQMPARIRAIVEEGRGSIDTWSFAIYGATKPENYKGRGGNKADRPEYALVQWAAANTPQLLLNDPKYTGGRPRGKPRGTWGPRGVSPLKYLGVMLGIYQGHRWAEQPPHTRSLDTRSLVPVAHPSQPFAMYLFRSMKGPDKRDEYGIPYPRHFNPSPAAMQELYETWLAAQPAGYPREPRTISSAQDALAVSDNSPYWVDQP